MGIDHRENDSFGFNLASLGVCIVMSVLLLIIAIPALLPLIIVADVYSEPSVYIQELYVPALTQTTFDTSIFIDLEFQRAMAFTSYSYRDFKITLWYGLDRSFPVANHTVAGFSMEYNRSVHKKAAMEACQLPWDDAFHKVSGGSPVALLVVLVQKYKIHDCHIRVDSFSNECSRREAEAVVAEAVVWVDVSGEKVSKKPIILR